MILILLFSFNLAFGQDSTEPDFSWGNSSYFNMAVGEAIVFNEVEIELLELENHYNKIRLGNDTLWLKVSRRNLPVALKGVRVFVADNKNVKHLTDDKSVHGLLNKDALLCLSCITENMLEPNNYHFPVSFNDGFSWSAEEERHMFSYLGEIEGMNGKKAYRSYEGIGIDISDARGLDKHWVVAIENCTVVWIEDKNQDQMEEEACVLLKSEANPGIYYLYNHLYNKNVEVKTKQKLKRGELIGTSWGDKNWGHLQVLVIKSDSVPEYKNRFSNSVNFFPQLYELYFQKAYSFNKYFSKGKIEFGRPEGMNQNQKNTQAFEDYSGKGWILGMWNKADKVEWITQGNEGNVRLRKTLFRGSKAQSSNPKDYYEYEVNVRKGVYRTRVEVGDLVLPSWQKVEFEGVGAGSYSLKSGEKKWTNERVVTVSDYKLTIRIYVDSQGGKVAGLSQFVFQQVY